MSTPNIAFIGAGNMASSIVGGLIESGHPASAIRAADPYPDSLSKLRRIAPVETFEDNAAAVKGADVVILAVKPQLMTEALTSISAAVKEADALIISIAAGVTIDSMAKYLGEQTAIVRCMPNTPALLSCGASALFASQQVSATQRQYAEDILAAVGIVSWVDNEAALDAITALSGSGPAYFFLFMEAMIDSGCKLGLDRDTATAMAQQTALGAARMALESEADLATLRQQVTSPGGTTQAAVESFERDGLRDIIERAMQAAAIRAKELAGDTE
ncbi:pyrroline-5-carboxylate reductase [Parahaliea sp. F7430]|uniref:Pyrroline-5-carboxylate reductase n=1 Tax=Sediminihaliea albiluteola TaxID=2758564 RepID=A0A7W2TX65_9GAMM|nr:pyrroline-5-carboxylate reductase [Sediminihaliea albiluteola]MBA6413561.1 pyrroline-5-carboxylate reductase [Sediminihaliea albiluteola]